MGPHLTFHLGGGEGGMNHFMAHLGDQFQSQMDDLGTTRLPRARAQIDHRWRCGGGRLAQRRRSATLA